MNLLAINFFVGLFNVILLFCFCFAAAYIVKAVSLIAANLKPKKQVRRPTEKPQPPKEKEPEKIYYIVEKKRPAQRRRASPSEPKRIYFNE